MIFEQIDAGGDRNFSYLIGDEESRLCAVVDLHFAGKLPRRGFVRQEQVPLAEFLANRFGKCYATAEKTTAAAPL